MREQPAGEQLLETARQLIRAELLPSLPADKRHAALMIINAMGIAARQLKCGYGPELAEIRSLRRILGVVEADPAGADARPGAQLLDLNSRLCEVIRQGRADAGDQGGAVRQHLLDCARQRVYESNPKYLGIAA